MLIIYNKSNQNKNIIKYAVVTIHETISHHVVHSTEMRIKWLLNVELILLEHHPRSKNTARIRFYTGENMDNRDHRPGLLPVIY
jgi:hypothetical protein